jgi:hypothetical protein
MCFHHKRFLSFDFIRSWKITTEFLLLTNSHLNALQKQNYLGQVFTSVGQLLSFGPVIIDQVVNPFINNNLSVGYSFFNNWFITSLTRLILKFSKSSKLRG